MDLLLEGLWIKEIAARLNLKASSISTYKERIFEKLQVSTLIEMFQSVKGYKDMD
ncbi:LuxR C-terminal-related transcriptional regulator [Dyadobacter jiangsuensis]